MPLYDYLCLKCGKEFEEFSLIKNREKMKCGCGGRTKPLMSPTKKDWFRAHLNEHLSTNGPIFVKSKKHYKELCKSHGVTAKCLL